MPQPTAQQAAAGVPNERALLAALNENYVRAVTESDTAWFERHLAPNFLNSNPDGTLADRAAFIGQIATPVNVTGLRCEDVRIRILGDTAIIHARTAYAKPDGRPGTGRYTDIWIRQADGRWLCVAAHVTRG